MEFRAVAALLALGCLVLRGTNSMVLAYDEDSDFAEFDYFDTDNDFFEADMTLAPKVNDTKPTPQQQTYTPVKSTANEPNVVNTKSLDGFKIDDDTYHMSKEGKNKAEISRLHVEEEFLNRKHTARAETAAQRRDKRQEIVGGPNCTITNQTFTNQTFNNRDFSNCTFTNCTFTICTFNNCTFSNRSFTNCTFTKCIFNNSTFTNLTFTNCTFTVCTFTVRSFFNCAFTSCTFTVCAFPDCNFTNCKFTSTTFTPPTLHNCR